MSKKHQRGQENPLNPRKHTYRLDYVDDTREYVVSQHHTVLPCGAVSFYNQNDGYNPPRVYFVRTVMNGQLRSFGQVDVAPVGADVIREDREDYDDE